MNEDEMSLFEQRRLEALRLAISHCPNSNGEHVVRTAQIFERYLGLGIGSITTEMLDPDEIEPQSSTAVAGGEN